VKRVPSQSTLRRHRKNREAVRFWKWPAGTAVIVSRANGTTLATHTTSRAFLVDGAHAFVMVEGIPGNVRLARVVIRPKSQNGSRP
jgi:hypothetical protein